MRARPVLARVLLLLISTAAALGVAELVLRLVDYEYRPMRVEAGADHDARVYHLFGDDHFVYDPLLIWRPRAGHEPFNSMGYRGAEIAPRKESDTVRLVALGDSNTLGWGEAEGANWPAELQRLLRAEGGSWEVVNAGVWGYSSHQGIGRLREALELEPDVVLISFGSNDAHRVARSDREFAGGWLGLRRLETAFRSWRLGQLVVGLRDSLDPEGTRLQPRVGLEEYAANLETMIDDCRGRGAVPVILTRPFVGPVHDESWWKNFGPEYNRAAVRVAEEEGVLLIDVYSFFKTRDRLFADESHFTRRGHEEAAELIRLHLRAVAPPAAGAGEASARTGSR